MKLRLSLALISAALLSAGAGEVGWRRPLPPRRIPRPATAVFSRAAYAAAAKPSATVASGDETVDVLVAYDQSAAMMADWRYGGITNFAADVIERANRALVNSLPETGHRFRLVGLTLVEASAYRLDLDEVLDLISVGDGAWETVREQRRCTGADLALTLVDTGSASDQIGLSYAFEKEDDLPLLAEWAFSVCAIRAVAEFHTATHEMGHILGAGHSDRQAADPGPMLYPYSSGFYFEAGGRKLRTIMAYDRDGYGNEYEEVPYFSTPDVVYAGVALGTATNDNARTLRETFPLVAGLRRNYEIRYASGDGTGEMTARFIGVDTVARLDPCAFAPPAPGLHFAGWTDAGGRRYDDGVLVFNLAEPDASAVLTAVWEEDS